MHKSGIYIIVSTLDPFKLYVGSAINLQQREKRHFKALSNSSHFNSKLQNYYNKYGSNCFKFYVVQHVFPDSLISFEQFYINLLRPFFNINPVAGSRLGSKHSNKTKVLLSQKARARGRSYVLQFKRKNVVKKKL